MKKLMLIAICLILALEVAGCTKQTTTGSADGPTDIVIADEDKYVTDKYSVGYDKDSFEVFEDADTDSVTFSYCKDGVETAGSNVLTFYIIKDVQAKEFLEEKVEAMGGSKADIKEVSITATPETCYCYVQGGTSSGSRLTTFQTLYAIPCGKDVIYADGFRTLGPDENTELSIDTDFEYIMQTLAVK